MITACELNQLMDSEKVNYIESMITLMITAALEGKRIAKFTKEYNADNANLYKKALEALGYKVTLNFTPSSKPYTLIVEW